jgi:hypothetical protein
MARIAPASFYRIRHTGGEAQVRVPHNMVGSGWVYLGAYEFNAGSNATNGAVLSRFFRHLRGLSQTKGLLRLLRYLLWGSP